MEQLWIKFGMDTKIRLMEFYPASAPEVEHITATLDASQPLAYAVLQVPHPSFTLLRTFLEDDDSMPSHKIRSCTSSGKIRLVRERMGMPKPTRKR